MQIPSSDLSPPPLDPQTWLTGFANQGGHGVGPPARVWDGDRDTATACMSHSSPCSCHPLAHLISTSLKMRQGCQNVPLLLLFFLQSTPKPHQSCQAIQLSGCNPRDDRRLVSVAVYPTIHSTAALSRCRLLFFSLPRFTAL